MIPEGLEWASVDEILDDIKSVGWNYIRMYVPCSHPSPPTDFPGATPSR
jgi:hypothetical protein